MLRLDKNQNEDFFILGIQGNSQSLDSISEEKS